MNPTVLILSLVQILVGSLSAIPGVSPVVLEAAKDAAAVIPALMNAISSLSASGANHVLPDTILKAIGGIVDALKQDPNIPPDVLALLDSMDTALSKAFVADTAAQQAIDASSIQEITPLPVPEESEPPKAS